jgi:hypothetical protein
MSLTKEKLCEALAQDYANRASRGGADYASSYNHYLERCYNRQMTELVNQYKVQGLKEKHVQ